MGKRKKRIALGEQLNGLSHQVVENFTTDRGPPTMTATPTPSCKFSPTCPDSLAKGAMWANMVVWPGGLFPFLAVWQRLQECRSASPGPCWPFSWDHWWQPGVGGVGQDCQDFGQKVREQPIIADLTLTVHPNPDEYKSLGPVSTEEPKKTR